MPSGTGKVREGLDEGRGFDRGARRRVGVDRAGGTGGIVRGGWPVWARVLVSVLLLYHLSAMFVSTLVSPPAFSMLEARLGNFFAHYYELIDQGYAYHYYAPEPPPTPVMTARVTFEDGREPFEIRMPTRGTAPRLRYQRQLAQAHHLFDDVLQTEMRGEPARQSVVALSYARHLKKQFQGCLTVEIELKQHMIPPLQEIQAQLEANGSRGVDLDRPEYYRFRRQVGVYSCDDL